ncbi:Protein chain release factor B [Yersinia mollaretii ATCC 43969]|uniref:Protein chain release factor B n=1 Tax=Yersinia mollaretii (strain ATCC 43969 / DSM 18520 / CIP 103324 / CNY 7263 / WAIP 204) TaxID=349967 RepID=A0ABM9YD68_YERMW|nr:Protein chain release factor B [Yersinia mollaretii ATCC 43969]
MAGGIIGISPSSENSPLRQAESISEGNGYCFSQNSAGGKPLPVVDGEKHIRQLHDHLSQGKSSVCDLPDFSKVMNQGNESCIRASNILHGTKAALALFSMLPVDKRDSVTTEAKSFYKDMAKLSEDSGSANKQKKAEQKLKQFNKALLKELGLDNKSADKQSNLEQLSTGYLNEFVYSDVIDKLSGVVTPEQLEVIKGNPEKITEALYRDLNGTNNLMTATPNHGIQSPAISSVISPVFSPVFNNNLGKLAPALNKIADVLERVISLENRLLPGDTSVGSVRHVESTEVGTQTPEAPREMDPPTYAEVVEPLQSEKIQLKPTAPLMAAPMVQKTLTSGDDIDATSTRPPAAPQPEASPNIVLKKTTSSLNAQGTFFGAQGGVFRNTVMLPPLP